MAIIYTTAAITGRLNGLVTAIGAAGRLKVYGAGVMLANVPLATPCGVVNAGVLTFTSGGIDPSAAATGLADSATIETALGVLMISGLTVGIPLSGADIIMDNGINSNLISLNQQVSLLSGQIIGS